MANNQSIKFGFDSVQQKFELQVSETANAGSASPVVAKISWQFDSPQATYWMNFVENLSTLVVGLGTSTSVAATVVVVGKDIFLSMNRTYQNPVVIAFLNKQQQ